MISILFVMITIQFVVEFLGVILYNWFVRGSGVVLLLYVF